MIAIGGGPRTGKTTLATELGGTVRCTDEAMSAGWSEASALASHWFDESDLDIIEGVAVARALRKWLERNPEGKPCERLIWLRGAHVELTKGQASMGKGCETVLGKISQELQRRGVVIETRG